MHLKLIVVVIAFCLAFFSNVNGAAISSSCARFCIELYAPVCGSDGKTYSNSCFLSVANCDKPADSQITLVGNGACGGGGGIAIAI